MEIRGDVWIPDRLWSELVKYRAGYRCEECRKDRDEIISSGMVGKLHAHHIDHNHSNNVLMNGRCLCECTKSYNRGYYETNRTKILEQKRVAH